MEWRGSGHYKCKCLDYVASWKTRKAKAKKHFLSKEVQIVIKERNNLQIRLQSKLKHGEKDPELEKQFRK